MKKAKTVKAAATVAESKPAAPAPIAAPAAKIVEKKKRGKKTVFNRFVIKGVEYSAIEDAATALKLTGIQVYNRIRSTDEKYKDWLRYDTSGKNPENKVK